MKEDLSKSTLFFTLSKNKVTTPYRVRFFSVGVRDLLVIRHTKDKLYSSREKDSTPTPEAMLYVPVYTTVLQPMTWLVGVSIVGLLKFGSPMKKSLVHWNLPSGRLWGRKEKESIMFT